ncbi:ATPase [Actinomadura sp. NEAU-AAG7]|nr:ATPase [Actinomadura sp. NEAU-AAG7]
MWRPSGRRGGPSTREARDVRSGVRPADGGAVRPVRAGREGGRAAVTAQNTVGLVLAVLVTVLLVAALLFPERL